MPSPEGDAIDYLPDYGSGTPKSSVADRLSTVLPILETMKLPVLPAASLYSAPIAPGARVFCTSWFTFTVLMPPAGTV